MGANLFYSGNLIRGEPFPSGPWLFDHLGDDPGPDRPAAFPDREP